MAKEFENIVSKEVKSVSVKKKSLWRFLWLPTALLLAVAAGGLTGVLGSYYLNNSRFATEVSALATYRPPQVTTIYADDGETVLAEFAIEKRIPIKESDIPKNVEDALLAIEDSRFYDHNGLDYYRIGGAAFYNVTEGKTQGASTITQQLAKNLFLTKDQTFSRKFSEWAMALEIERLYTKRQILEMYMNYVFLGAGSYGFEAGSRTYFGKSLKDLSLEEAALLAAIPKSPEYSPTRNMEKALDRRNTVLDQMVRFFPERYSQSDVDAAKAKPIKLNDTAYYQSQPKSTPWDYPVEEVRKYLEDKYTTRVAQGGLQVYTTINVEAQKLATKAVREGLRRYDNGKAWRSEYQTVLLDNNGDPVTVEKDVQRILNNYKHADWYGDSYEKGEYIKGLIMKIDANGAQVRFGRYNALITGKDMGRSGKSPANEFKVGDLAEFLISNVDNDKKTISGTLSQVPEVQASIVSINAKTGEVVALVGGYDFHTSKFNNATQGLRQTGSCYKPFIYTAAVENGMTPNSVVSGAPIKRGGWSPSNYGGSKSHGNVPMKVALAKSYNIAAVHLLDQVGIQAGAQMVRRFGITNPMAPSLPSALGASEASLLEMVSAYSVFPNKGMRVQPHLIRKVMNRDGSLLEEWQKTTYRVTSDYVALTMVDMMRGVVQGGGTATSASAGGHPLAGKTGTVNDETDVWFIGYTPTYVTGIWMGNPLRKESLGKGMTGGHGAVPYFNAFMVPFMKDKKRETFEDPPPIPSDIKSLIERNKREEQEKLESADEKGRNTGITFTPTTRRKPTSGGDTTTSTTTDSTITNTGEGDNDTPVKPQNNPTPVPRNDTPTKVPQNTPTKKPDVQEKPSGTTRKGKKGGGDN